jgi:hypothetical protein
VGFEEGCELREGVDVSVWFCRSGGGGGGEERGD